MGLPRAAIKSHPEEKVGVALIWGAPQNFEFPYISATAGTIAASNLACSWGLPKPIIKSHAEERVDVAFG